MDRTDQPQVAAPVDLNGTEDLSDLIDDQTACVVVQNPSVFGQLRHLSGLARACPAKGALLDVVVTEVTSLGLSSEESRVGKECVSTCSSRWSPYHDKQQITKTQQHH